jgi:ABC-type polysaccharide/polyol phosphate export permease
MLTAIREIVQYRSLLRDLVARDLKVRYKRSVLGIAWTMLNPLLTMIVFTMVFSQVLRVPVKNFTVYFLSGFLLWNFVAQTTSWSTGCLLGYAPLIKKIYVPRAIFVLATVLAGFVNLLLSLIPLGLIMLVVGHPFHLALTFIPIPMFLGMMFALGLSLLLAPLSVMFADIVPIYQVVLTLWLYLTPVMYPAEMVPAAYRGIVDANPMSYFVEAFRAPIYGGTLPAVGVLAGATAFAVGAMVLGWMVFDHYTDRIAYYV